jgi:hypothetical protein
MSALYRGISPLDYDAEKAGMEYDTEKAETLTLCDVSGMLLDYKESDYSSSASSSASSDTESVGGEGEEIEVSSLHRGSVGGHVPMTLAPPEPMHTHFRRASADVPMPVSVVDGADIL